MGEGEHASFVSLLFHVLLPSADNLCTIRTQCLSIRMTTGQVSTQVVWSPCESHCPPCTDSLCTVVDPVSCSSSSGEASSLKRDNPLYESQEIRMEMFADVSDEEDGKWSPRRGGAFDTIGSLDSSL